MFLELGLTIQMSRVNFLKFWDAIMLSIQHRLSVDLISPDLMFNILCKIRDNLISPHIMVWSVTRDDLDMYYKFCAVSVFEEMDVLNVVLTFPVTSYGLRYQ